MNDYDRIDYSFDSRSLVNRNSSGDIKFAHKSFLEFFLAKEKWEHPDFSIDFEGMDMALLFFYEMFQKEVDKNIEAGNIEVTKDDIPGRWNITGIKSVSFVKEPVFRYEWFSKLFELQHVTLHKGVINQRMMNWINTTSIRSIMLIGAELKSMDFLLVIPHV